MDREVKRIQIQNGELFAEMDERRIKMCDCEATVQVLEHVMEVPILGKGRIIDKRYIGLLITFNHINAACVNDALSGFSFSGDAQQSDGTFRKLTFSRCELIDELDITGDGSCGFEVRCSQRMIDTLRAW